MFTFDVNKRRYYYKGARINALKVVSLRSRKCHDHVRACKTTGGITVLTPDLNQKSYLPVKASVHRSVRRSIWEKTKGKVQVTQS